MSNPLQQYAEQPGIDPELKESLQNLESGDASALARVLDALNPSLNTIRSLFRLCREIGARDDIALSEIFAHSNIQQLLETKMSRKQKALALQKELEAIRYPEIARIHGLIDASLANLRRDLGVKLEVPKDLEGRKISISFEVEDPEGFKKTAQVCNQLSEHPDLQKLFSILHGEGLDAD